VFDIPIEVSTKRLIRNIDFFCFKNNNPQEVLEQVVTPANAEAFLNNVPPKY
jgi:hypothetical protein